MRDTPVWQDWNVRLISSHDNGNALFRIQRFTIALWSFVIELVLRRPAVVHLHVSHYGSFGRKAILAWISIVFRVPVVLHMHGSRFHAFFTEAPRPSRFLIRATLEHASILIALGDVWAARLRATAPKASIFVLPNAVRPGVAVNQRVCGTVNTVFLGEVGERKGVFTLIEAWAKVQSAESDVSRGKLSIAGNGEVERARRLVAELGLEETVTVAGWLASADVGELLDVSQILVLPSTNEGQPMAILEAMARGLCVIATDVGGIPEMLRDGAGLLLAKPQDVDGLADAMAYAIRHEEARISMGANALERVRKEFDVAILSNRLDSLYRSLAFE